VYWHEENVLSEDFMGIEQNGHWPVIAQTQLHHGLKNTTCQGHAPLAAQP
jgi:hypothetical protein